MLNNSIRIFEDPNFSSVRTIMIDGEPWFFGKDVAVNLGYSNERDALSKHVDSDDKNTVAFRDGTSGNPNQTIINESGLYSLIFGSKLESAKKFKKWVTSEVLPALRKTGTYSTNQKPLTIPEQIQLLAQGYTEVNEKIDSIREDFETFKTDMPILGVEENRITKAVQKKGVEVLGGKDSNAYQDKSIRGKIYSDIHRQLKREFGISTYKAIKRSQTDTAIGIVKAYTPPLVLAETIDTENAQIEFGMNA